MENGKGGSIRCCRPFPVLRVVERILVCENQFAALYAKDAVDTTRKLENDDAPSTRDPLCRSFLGPKILDQI